MDAWLLSAAQDVSIGPSGQTLIVLLLSASLRDWGLHLVYAYFIASKVLSDIEGAREYAFGGIFFCLSTTSAGLD